MSETQDRPITKDDIEKLLTGQRVERIEYEKGENGEWKTLWFENGAGLSLLCPTVTIFPSEVN